MRYIKCCMGNYMAYERFGYTAAEREEATSFRARGLVASI